MPLPRDELSVGERSRQRAAAGRYRRCGAAASLHAMKTLVKIAFAAAVVRAALYVVRRQRAMSRDNGVRDASPRVPEPLRSEDLNVAQNAPL
jgi:hypothetical protein